MRRLLTALLLLSACAAPASSQEGAKKIDEFGAIQVSDMLARLDNFAIELQNNPAAKGYVVVYVVPNDFPGAPLRRANWARGYLVNGRHLEEERVEVVNGGYRDEVTYQFWLTEAGARLPVAAFDFGAALAREKGAYLFDRYQYFDLSPKHADIDFGYIGYLDEKGLYAGFADALRYDPAARGCVIAYATRRERRGADRRLAARVKLGVLKYHALGAERVVALGGGRGSYRMIELWIVPPGAALPKPSRPRRTPPRSVRK